MFSGEEGAFVLYSDKKKLHGAGEPAGRVPPSGRLSEAENREVREFQEFKRWKEANPGTPEYREFREWQEWKAFRAGKERTQ